MNNTDDYIQKDEDTDGTSSDTSLELLNTIQRDSLDTDELQQLLGESFVNEANDCTVTVNTEKVFSSSEDKSEISALEELDELYGVTAEAQSDTDEPALSALDELEALYGDSAEIETVASDAISQAEDSTDEDTPETASLLDEIEALYGDSVAAEPSLPASGLTSSEDEIGTTSALDELRAFFGETAPDEAATSDPSTSDTVDSDFSSLTAIEDYSVSRRSVLEELQNLLLSCIDELKAETKTDSITTDSSDTDVVYPERAELQSLLETMLGKLLLISDNTENNDIPGRDWIADELDKLMSKTVDETDPGELLMSSEGYERSVLDGLELLLEDAETSDVTAEYDDSVADNMEQVSVLDKFDSYMSELSDVTKIDELEAAYDDLVADSMEKGSVVDEFDSHMYRLSEEPNVAEQETAYEASITDNMEQGSVLDEFDSYMSERSEEPGVAKQEAAYDDPLTDNMEEGSVLDEFDSYMSERSEEPGVAKQEAAYDDPVTDNMEQSSALDEFDSYMSKRSEVTEVDEQEVADEETGVNAVAEDSVASSDALADLEAMLDEINMPGMGIGNEEVNANEDESSEEAESPLPTEDHKQEEYKADSEPYSQESSVEVETGIAEADSIAIDKASENSAGINAVLLSEPDKNFRLPVTGLLFSAMFAVAIYGAWSWLDNADETGSRSQAVNTRQLKQAPNDHEHNTGQALVAQESVVQERTEETSLAASDSIYQLQTKTVASDTVEPGFVDMDEYKPEPEPVNAEFVENTDIVSEVAQEPQLEDAQIIPDDQAEQPDDLQMADLQAADLEMTGLQEKNKENIESLNKRMIEAEETIASLQVDNNITTNIPANLAANKNAHVDVEPVTTVQPDQVIEPTSPASQQIIDWTEQKVAGDKVTGKPGRWSVHLASYYGKPPTEGELEHLANAGISYEIKKAIVNEGIWYRVVVNEFSDYVAARKYFEQIRQKSVRRDIWINRSQ